MQERVDEVIVRVVALLSFVWGGWEVKGFS